MKEHSADENCVAICNCCKKLSASCHNIMSYLNNPLATCLNTKVQKRKKLVVRSLFPRGDMDH